jgi:transaldolase/transaldolase/glucose-6-phosphate isomerase
MIGQLPQLGINIDKLTQKLEDEGVDKFNKSFDSLIKTQQKATGK